MEKPLVSILIPVYNCGHDIHTTIMSCLKQTYNNLEIIIINDGSTDNTLNEISLINDDRIKVYTKKKNNGISEALNYGLTKCNGKFVARFDGNEIMDENRISIQVEYMLKNLDCDIITTNLWAFDNNHFLFGYNFGEGVVTKEEINNCNTIGHPTVMFRVSSLKKLPYVYEQYYDGCEDYRLWFNCIDYGLKIHRIDYKSMIWYANGTEKDGVKILVPRMKHIYNKVENYELTCVLVCHNDGIEVIKTITSIKATTNNSKILLVDNCSNDKYNYQEISLRYDCDYIRTNEYLPLSKCRNFAVSKCNTEYFVILDCGLRFYDDNWDEKLLNILKENNNSIVYSCLTRIDCINGEYFNENNKDCFKQYSKGCYIDFGVSTNFIKSRNAKEYSKLYNDMLIETTCIQSSVYATSKTWWDELRGLDGLEGFGSEDVFLSAKNFLLGGKSLLIKDWFVGKVHNNKTNYNSQTIDSLYDRYILIWFLLGENYFHEMSEKFRHYVGKEKYNQIIDKFRLNSLFLIEYYDNFKHKKIKTINELIELNAAYIFAINKIL